MGGPRRAARPPRAYPCVLASLARVPFRRGRKGTVDSCLRRNDGGGRWNDEGRRREWGLDSLRCENGGWMG